MTDNPINISNVYTRYTSLNDTSKKRQSLNFHSIKRPISFNNAENYLSGANSVYESNLHYYEVLTILDEASFILTESQTIKLGNFVKSNILPKIESSNLLKVEDCIKSQRNYTDTMRESLLESIDTINLCDRVLNNNKMLNKRFNIDKVISDKSHLGCEKITMELCKLIDTYNIPINAKYNVALENGLYSLDKKFGNGIGFERKDIVNYITEYFLLRDNVITDPEYASIIKVLESNKFISKDDIQDISYIFEGGNTYHKKLDIFAESVSDPSIKKNILNIKRINTEKDCERYLTKTQSLLNEKEDQNKIFDITTSIIPLVTKIPSTFIEGILKKDKSSTLLELSQFVNKCIPSDTDIFDDTFKNIDKDFYNNILESSDTNSSDDVSDIIKKFKADQEKSPNRFYNMITKIWTKDPRDIINDSPKIFSLVRYLFIFSIAAVTPIGPIIAGITALIDKTLSDELNNKQAGKLLTYLNNELSLIEDKMDKMDSDSTEYKKAKSYKDCIHKSIDKTEEFKSSLNVEDDDELEDFDEVCMQLISLTESVSHVLNLDRDNILNEIENNIDRIVKTDLEGYSIVIANCPSLINLKEYASILENYKKNKADYKESTDILLTLDKLYSYRLEDVSTPNSLIELESSAILEQAIHESFKLNNVKLIFMNFKKKVKDLSTKAKSIWQSIDVSANRFKSGIEKAMTTDRREAIIRGDIIPSFSRCIKAATTVGVAGFFTGPIGALITAFGLFATSEILTHKEKLLLYDEIDTELKVLEKQLNISENEGDMNQYRFLLNYQKKLLREKMRIKHGMQMIGKPIVNPSDYGKRGDE